MIKKILVNNKIIYSIIFFIVANLIFNHKYLLYYNNLDTDFSIIVREWFLGQWLFSYQLEFVKRGFIATIFQFFNVNINFQIIYLFSLVTFNILIILFISFINKIDSKKIILLLFSIILFSPFSIISFSYNIGRFYPLIYLFLILLISLNLKNKNELYFTLPVSVICILIHEISLFIIFPIIFLIKFENCFKNKKFYNLIVFSIVNIFTYLLIFIFGEASFENANIIYQQVLEIKPTNFNTVLYFVTGIYDANNAYVRPTFFNNIYNFNFGILLSYVFLNYLISYNIFKNYFLFNRNIFSLMKLFILFLIIFILYYFTVSYFDQICEFIFQKNLIRAPILRGIVLKLSFLFLILIYFYITHLYGFKKFISYIYSSSDFLLFLTPLIIFLTFFVGSDYAIYTSLILINLLIISIYFFQKFDYKKLYLKYLNFFLIFNFLIFIFFHLHTESFERNLLLLK